MARSGDLIVVGTYEGFVLGFTLAPDTNNSGKFLLHQSFATQTHSASVRTLATGGRILASGGADESIQLYDLEKQVTSGSLGHHNGTVNTVAFSEDRSFLLSGADDGVLAAIQTGSWFVEKVWKSAHHSKAVTGISIHPSGKLALSIGSDNRIITWDLVKGRRAFVTNVSSRCKNSWGLGDVLWSPDGSNYAVFMESHVEVYAISSAAVSLITCCNRVTSICFLQNDILIIGEENGEASIHQLKSSDDGAAGTNQEIVRFEAHDRRVKVLKNIGPVKGLCNSFHFVSACSNGVIRVWKWEDEEVNALAEVDCDCRITCLEFVHLNKVSSIIGQHATDSEENPASRLNGNARSSKDKSRTYHLQDKKSKKLGSHDDSTDIPQKKRRTSKFVQPKVNGDCCKWIVKEKVSECLGHEISYDICNLRSVNAGTWNVSS